MISCYIFFFFSSRRRHTRWTGDWSSDVCSSDLDPRGPPRWLVLPRIALRAVNGGELARDRLPVRPAAAWHLIRADVDPPFRACPAHPATRARMKIGRAHA